jgi:hypothetical protein
MRRSFWILLLLFAPLLTPTDAWEASVSQNLTITITAGSGGSANILSVDPTNLDPNGNNMHAAAIRGAEVSRFYITKTPFYPTASTATWSLSLAGAAVGHFSLSSSSGIPVMLTTDGTRGTFTSPGTITVSADGGANFVYTLPTIVVHGSGDANTAVATCGSGSTIATAITSAGAGGTVVLQACTYSQQTFTMSNNQRLQGAGSTQTRLDGTGNASAMTNAGGTSVTIDSVGVTGYANVGYSTCDTGGANSFTIRTNDGWVFQNSSVTNSGCDAINGNWGAGTTRVLNNTIVNAQRNGMACFPNEPGETGTFTFQGNEIAGANEGNYAAAGGTTGVAASIKCFSVSNVVNSTVNILNNYIHDSFPATEVGGDASTGIWFDTVHTSPILISLQGNTILNNGRNGIADEASCGIDISHNFIKGNTGNPSSGTNSRGIMLRQNGPVNVHDNNVSVPASGQSYSAIEFEPSQSRTADTCSQGINVNIYLNDVTFFDTSSFSKFPVNFGNVIFDSTSEAGMSVCSGTTACGGGNRFHDLNGTGTARYQWYVRPGVSTTWNFTTYKANSGQDAQSTLDAVDGTSGITGCLHIACTGAGL